MDPVLNPYSFGAGSRPPAPVGRDEQIDELHYVDRATPESLIIGLHRASQLALPVVEAGAGLPTLAGPDDGFFRVRADTSTKAERRYMLAMAHIGPGPVRTAGVAEVPGREPSAVTPIRESLLGRSLYLVPEQGRIDFTVPMFGGYMNRIGTPDTRST